MRVYRWDLDKTYLDTDFESVRGLFRSAVESARNKRAIPGATALLRELARERPGQVEKERQIAWEQSTPSRPRRRRASLHEWRASATRSQALKGHGRKER